MTFPDDERQRRLLLPLSDADRAVCEGTPETLDFLLDPAVHIVELPLSGELHPVLAALERSRHIEPQKLLLQSPIDASVYYELGEAAELIATAKLHAAVEVCQAIGARRVSITRIRSRDLTGEWDIEIKGTKARIGGEAHGRATAAERLAETLSIETSFSGAEPDFEEADRLLDETTLRREPMLPSLVRMRERPNAPVRQIVKVGTTSEAEKVKALLAKVKTPFGSVQGAVERTQQQICSYELTFEVEFRRASPGTRSKSS